MNTSPILIGLLLVTTAHAQTAPKSILERPAASPSKAQKSDQIQPFDSSVQRLPRHYSGHNLLEVMQRVRPLAMKSEFEKTEEFEARSARWMKTPYLGTLTPGSLLAFAIIPGLSPNGLKIDYNADQEIFTAKVSFEDRTFSSGSFNWLETFYSSKDLGTRNAVTRMGVKFQVTTYVGSSVGVAIPQTLGPVSVTIPVSRVEALSLKNQIRAIAVVKLFEPYRISENTAKSASLDEPTEWHNSYVGVSATLDSVLFVNWQTGEILARQDAPFER